MIVRNTEILLNLSKGITDQHSFKKMIDAIYNITAHRLHFTRMNLIQYRPEAGLWRRIARRDYDGRPIIANKEHGDLFKGVVSVASRYAKQPQLILDYWDDPDAKCFPDFVEDGLRSGIHIYLYSNGKLVGLYSVQHVDPGKYTPDDCQFIFEVGHTISDVMMDMCKYEELSEGDNFSDSKDSIISSSITEDPENDNIIGSCQPIKHLRGLIRRVALTDTTVLILGETGTGKALAAEAIHTQSQRNHKPFVTVNCAGFASDLVSSELFGHEAGAFTGASKMRKGRFEIANGGTLFLDEIGDISPETQVRLLRVIENGEFERVGGSESLVTDVRILAATHRNLEEMVAQGTFRADLRYRLNAFPLVIPPLRDRGKDIMELATLFANRIARKKKMDTPSFSQEVVNAFMRYPWSGNVRELCNVIDRAMILNDRGQIDIHQIPLEVAYNNGINLIRESTGSTQQSTLRSHAYSQNSTLLYSSSIESDDYIQPLDTAIREHIIKALVQSKGKVSGQGGAADLLQLRPKTLESKMKKLGICREWK